MNTKQILKSHRSLAVIIPAVFVYLAMARLAGAASQQITPLQFDGGNGSANIDQYPGGSGNGWGWNAWKANVTSGSGNVTATVVNTTPFGYGSGGNYLSVTCSNSTSGGQQCLERQCYGAGNGNVPATYTVTWKFRLDSPGLPGNTTSDYIRFCEQNYSSATDMAGGGNTTWLITAVGANYGNAVANTWAFYNGGKDSGGFSSSLLVNSGIQLVQGHVYTFTVVQTPANTNWVGSVLDNTTGAFFKSGTLGYRIQSGNLQGYLYFIAHQNTPPTNTVFSLDDVSVGVVASHSTVSPATATAPADGTTTKTITVQARDYNNTNVTVGGESVVFSTTAGTVSAATDNGDGTYTATWTAPSSVGSGTATVTATLGGGNVGTAVSASSCVITLQQVVPPGLLWAVGNGTWDVNNSANWKNLVGTTGFVFTNGAPVIFDDTATGTSPIAVSLNTTVNPTNVTANLTNKNYTISGTGAIAGPIGLTQNGPGTLTLATTNTYSGGTTTTGGILEADATGALGSGLLTMSGGVLSNNVSATLTNSVNLGSDTTFGVGSGQTLKLGGVITNAHALTKTGAGTLTLGVTNTYTGNTTVNAGTLRLVSPGGIYSAAYSGSIVAVNTGGVIEFDKWGSYSTTAPFGQLDFGSSHIVVNGGTLRSVAVGGTSDNRSCTIGSLGGTLDSSVANQLWTIAWASSHPSIPLSGPLTLTGAGNGEIDQNITNSGSVLMNGTGTWTLTGTNTYSGATTISAGTLLVNGSITSAVTNQSEATFGGAGTVTGDVGLASGAFTLFTNGAVLTINGNLILNGNTVKLNLSNNVPAGTYTLATFTGTASGSFAAIPTIKSGSIKNGSTPTVSINGNSVLLTVSKVTPTATLTLSAPATVNYTGSAQSATVATNSSSVPGTVNNVKYNGSATVPTVSGTYAVTADFIPNDTVNYNPLTGLSAGTFTINKATTTATLAVGNSPVTYDGNPHAATVTISASSVAGIVQNTLTGGAATQTAVGTYAVTADFVPNDTNYTTLAGLSAGNFVINPATSTVTLSGSSFTYNGLAQTPSISISGSTGTRSTNYTGIGYASGNAPTNAGSYTLTVVVLGDANYIGTTNSQSFVISPKAAYVTADNQSKTYGTANPPLTATVAGTANGDALNYTLATDATQYSAVGVSNITVTLGSNPNYSVNATNGTLTINQASTFVGASSTMNPSGYKDTVAYVATLSADATGSVVFSSANGPISTNDLSSGSATSFGITNLPRGTNVITFAYAGDDNYVGSTNTLNQIVTNHPPVANNVSYTRNAAVTTFKVLVSDLLTNATDADGDTLSLLSVGSSTNGAILSVSSGYVLYYDTNAVADQFTYTVIDGYGGTNSGMVTLNIDSTPIFGQSQVASVVGGVATLRFAGVPGYSYSVVRSTNLVDWAVLWTTNAPAGGLFDFTDNPAPQPSAYYHLQYNP
jgi:autotransporter-associated beta strand protein